MLWLRLAALALLLGTGPIAEAQTGAEAQTEAAARPQEFFGRYLGQGIAKNRDNLYFGVALRDLDTAIDPAPDGGFVVKWITVTRDSDGQPTRRSEQSLTFKPTARPGLYAAAGNSDPVGGGAYAWARIEGRLLIVNIVEVSPAGTGSWAIYERRLVDGGMELVYRRLDLTGTVRIVSGKLRRQP